MPLPTPRLAPVTTATLPRNDDTIPSFFQGNPASEWKQSRSPLSGRCPPHRALAITAERHGPVLEAAGEQVAAVAAGQCTSSRQRGRRVPTRCAALTPVAML